MVDEPAFTVELDDERVVLVPEFWPSALDEDARHEYDGLRERHVVDDGALSMPAEYLPETDLEPGSTVTLDAVWNARIRRLASYGVGFFPIGDADRDRIAQELLDGAEHDALDEDDYDVLDDADDDDADREPRILTDDCRV